jgi:hypothetical protein
MTAINNKVRKAVREIRVVIVTKIMQSVLNYALHNKAYDLIRGHTPVLIFLSA